jgi:hypothetical protein
MINFENKKEKIASLIKERFGQLIETLFSHTFSSVPSLSIYDLLCTSDTHTSLPRKVQSSIAPTGPKSPNTYPKQTHRQYVQQQ